MGAASRTARCGAGLCLLLLAACERGQSGGTIGGDREISGTVIDDSEALGAPEHLAVVDSSLVILDNVADSVVRVLRLPDGSLRWSAARRGRGPGEILNAWNVSPEPGGAGRFLVLDANQNRLLRYDVGRAGVPETIRMEVPTVMYNLVGAGDSLLLALGFFRTPGRFARLDGRGRFLGLVGEPPPGDTAVPLAVRNHAWQSMLAYEPVHGRVAVAPVFADRIETYRATGERLAVLQGPERFVPRYQVASRQGEPALSLHEGTRFGYVDVAVTERFVYGLFSGRRQTDGAEAPFGREIHVFGWDGSLRERLTLDHPALSLAVSPDDRWIYAARHDPRPAIVRYDGPEAPARAAD